ncbi:hypothetical protein CBR_g11950 [Chara braunii]|uniref:Core Histone H2A/H2B/H3 domain-containing protein n=1 Tax=Chara braunii TaxID=69332 RepID=A0A388KQR6_CHABU|nr:hypothetical protein CBR_g11950 [Chara braunii]|eukprot:GBG72372.1 hypothetical protein CBR_g11950 [Chara braunii]
MMGDGDETENDAGGSTCETGKVGEEREEGGLGSRESLTGCIVKDENVVKTSGGEEYPYDINWVPGRVQPGIVGGAPYFSFKVDETWVSFPAPKMNTWRNVTLSIVFDRVLRLNDEATPQEKGRYALEMWRVMEAQGEFRLNDLLYDSFDCRQSWVIGGNDATGSTTCHESDARRDPRWGWVPCAISIPCGRARMMMRDAMGNVWSTHYVNGNFSFRNLDREVSEDEKKAMACPTHTAGCFFPRLRNPVELEVVEGKVFTGAYGSTYTHARGQKATQEQGDGQNRYMAHIRLRHGCTTVLGWVPVVCPMTYEHGGDVTMRFRDPLGVPFHLTYSDGLLRDIQYLAENDLAGSAQPGKRTEKRSKFSRLSAEVEGPCGPGRVGGCSATQGDMGGPSDVAMSQSPGKMKKCTSEPSRGQTPADRKKMNPKAVPATGDTAGARTQVPRCRRRPEMATLSEIRKLQRFTDLCLAFRTFLRLVREVVEEDIAPGMGVRFQMTAVHALMEAVEVYLVANFENTNEVAFHSKRVTIQVKDMRLVDRLSKPRWVEKYKGAVNIVSDESEDVGAPKNIDGEGGTFEEQQPQPVKSFDSSRKLAALIFSVRGGVGTKPVTGPRMENKDEDYRREVASEPLLPLTIERSAKRWQKMLRDPWSLKAVGKKDKGRKKCKADKKKETREHRRNGSRNAKMQRTNSRRNGSKVSLPSSQREISKLKERNESPPATPAPRNRVSGVENRPPKAPEKWSREDGMSKVHRRTKKRITYKKDRMVEMIDLRGSENMHSAAREEAEEEHDQSISEKSDGEENEATSDEGGDSETSDGLVATLATLMTRTAGATTTQGRTRAMTGQTKMTEARMEERVPNLREERGARRNPKVTAREAQPTRPRLTDK